MDILRITARWSGFTGAPGYSVFYFSTDNGFWDGGLLGDAAQEAADGAAQRVTSAFGSISGILPDGVQVKTEGEGDILNSDTGEIISSMGVETYAAVTGSGTGGYAGPSGAVVNWRTNDYRAGRRIRGRTFIVPLASSAYEDDGTLTSAALSDLRDFGEDMHDDRPGGDFGIWSRPRGGSGGVWATVVGSTVPDMAAVLRSRRD